MFPRYRLLFAKIYHAVPALYSPEELRAASACGWTCASGSLFPDRGASSRSVHRMECRVNYDPQLPTNGRQPCERYRPFKPSKGRNKRLDILGLAELGAAQ
jgi:hypothetical protein